MAVDTSQQRSRRGQGRKRSKSALAVSAEGTGGSRNGSEAGLSEHARDPLGIDRKVNLINKLLRGLEEKLEKEGLKASLGDFIRLLQLQKELAEEQPREIIVKWVGSSETDCVTKT